MHMKLPISKKPLIVGIGLILLIIALAPSLYFYSKYQEVQKVIKDPAQLTKAENKALIEKVGKIIVLPENEEPEIRSVTNKDEVKDQAFFQGAENGDKVLIYSNAKKAFLYRPSQNKIINVAPINVTNPTPIPTTPKTSPKVPTLAPTKTITPSSTPTAKLEGYKFYLYNGTNKIGLTKTYEASLIKALPGSEVIDRDNAKNNDYIKSIIILINDAKANVSSQVAKSLNLPLEKLPDGEVKPKEAVDFLIILGSDKANL